MSFVCARCTKESHNPNDEREGYCGYCKDWTGRHPATYPSSGLVKVPVGKKDHLVRLTERPDGFVMFEVWPDQTDNPVVSIDPAGDVQTLSEGTT